MEVLDHYLGNLVGITKFFLESFSVLCIILGLIKTLHMVWAADRRTMGTPKFFNSVRLQFGLWLALALEFQLGADILSTTIAPTLESLSKLGLIAVIRTFLNYFLGKELESEIRMEMEQQERSH
ncbi:MULTISPECIES: DUF1622 domain-containing protein [Synechocystis]|uniref:DUF1622 domain-containing protein n=1 Tax=Synechocystis salina LEGE 00031 TaxID=1828736 RepID=A0ABR9VYE9_9SYNC|nr:MULTISPECIES: DUF1622 domain-containing protein [Synechocystis]MBD2654683.1 DUF1622 domain-containing protein [Synechocystis sp. FACHB-383]MBE9195825.1 DUF1622 domain-containing protein [Synechocystis sp. LEGE 06083]MBE9241941.1 DUF1622 domain-containing protein [Synechocystis salina LEGE 00041]MBE9255398.1 DUF1622 domain-containing protein [Synechocystis salina LEGE 00031]